MSDTPQGEGWWLASDGKWYPPQSAQTQSQRGTRPWWKKKRFIIPLALVALLLVIGVASSGSDTKKSSAPASALGTGIKGSSTASSTTVKSDGPAKVTLAEYNQIQNGMTYAEVVSIFSGKEQSASSSSLGGATVDTLTWNGDGFGDTVIIQFDGPKESGKVMTKSQYGLG